MTSASMESIFVRIGEIQTKIASFEAIAGGDRARQSDPRVAARAPMKASDAGMKEVPAEFRAIIDQASAKAGLSRDLIAAVMRQESGFDARAVSRKGAKGLMQLMPETAKELGVADVFDPAQNVEGGARYLRSLLDKYGGNLVQALAAYNAGPTAVDGARGGVPNYDETRSYVKSIVENLFSGGESSVDEVR